MLRGVFNGQTVFDHGMGAMTLGQFQRLPPEVNKDVDCISGIQAWLSDKGYLDFSQIDGKWNSPTTAVLHALLPGWDKTPGGPCALVSIVQGLPSRKAAPAPKTAPKKAPTGKGSSTRPFEASTQAPSPEFWGQQPPIDWKMMAMGGAALALVVLLLGRRPAPVVVASAPVSPVVAPK